MNNTSKKLLNFLRVLTADGRLSGEEVWLLADYFNHDKEACAIWPGNMLVPVLQRVFQDGVLTEQEMMEVAAMICHIEQHAATLVSELEPQAEPPPLVPPVIKPTERLTRLALPSVNWRGHVESSDGETEYNVDLMRYTCTCPDWAGRRAKLAPGSIGRACKHIVRSLHAQDEFENFPPIIRAIIEDAFFRDGGTAPGDDYLHMDLNGNSIFVSYTGGDWANVLAPDGNDYSRFGYNITEQRWSYGEAPKGARKIKEFRIVFL